MTLVVLLAGLVLCVAHGAAGRSQDPGFDLLLLVRTWPATFCEELREERQACDRDPVGAFTLHGLWPEFASGGWPQFCRWPGGGGDDPGAASPRQRCEWPSFHLGADAFWEHEWSKHGTCAGPVTGNRSAYFATALRLHDQFNLNQVLAPLGILPGSSASSFISPDIQRVLREAWGADPLLACHRSALAEVWLCLDLDLELIECPERVRPRSPCPAKVTVPPGTQVGALSTLQLFVFVFLASNKVKT